MNIAVGPVASLKECCNHESEASNPLRAKKDAPFTLFLGTRSVK